MIDLTPIDVRKKKGDFKRAVRGYDTDLVDDFLDLVAERLEELVKQNMSLTDRLSRIEEQVGEYRQRDKALTEALVTAQEVREEVRRQAEKEAELVRREAEADAERIRSEAASSHEREEDNLRRLRARRLHMIQSFRTFLERELAELAVSQEMLEQEGAEAPRADTKKAAAAAAAPKTRASAPRTRVTPPEESADEAQQTLSQSRSQSRSPSPSPSLPLIEEPAPNAGDEDGPDWLSSIMEDKK